MIAPVERPVDVLEDEDGFLDGEVVEVAENLQYVVVAAVVPQVESCDPVCAAYEVMHVAPETHP